MNNTGPNYKLIYSDIISLKYPNKKDKCEFLLSKTKLSELDILTLNNKIFGNGSKSAEIFSRKHRSYNKSTILEILEYQKKNSLNNIQLSYHFKVSRNTVAKWKKIFM